MKLMPSYEEQLSLQVEQRRLAVELIKVVSDLWYENNIELYLFRNQLIDRNVGVILNLMEYAREFVQKPLSFTSLVKIARKIDAMNLPCTESFRRSAARFSSLASVISPRVTTARRRI